MLITYQDFPTAEWTIYLKNNGAADTPILEDIQGLDIFLERNAGESEAEFLLHHNVGAPTTYRDYRPLEAVLAPGSSQSVGAAKGRPNYSDMSYFNLDWGGQGMIIVIGWPGQWKADFVRDATNGLHVRAGQELTHLVLHPGEEIRTPLIVLQFWKSGDWIDAQNVWRRWMLAYNVPRVEGKLPQPILAGASCGFIDFDKCSAANQAPFIIGSRKHGIPLNFWWLDAGWYPCDDDWHVTGSWWPDPVRFPSGMKPLVDLAHANGMGFILWFEPERVRPNTWLRDKHPQWILGGDAKNGLLNLGDPQALDWLINHFDKMVTDFGIDVYRQDFNMNPLEYWRNNDAPDRQGMTEMRYVQGYLTFWDELRRRHPNLLIDACASGGKRNDLESMRRAVPLWRSDYARKSATADQNQTFGISFWLPYNGSGQNLVMDEKTNTIDEYWFRSNMYQAIHAHYDTRTDIPDQDHLKRLIAQWQFVAPFYYGDYYPLTPLPASEEGDDYVWMAWQLNRPQSGDGIIQAFRRPLCPDQSAQLRLRELQSEGQYEIRDIDTLETKTATGRELMDKGLDIVIPDKPGAVVIAYKIMP